MKLEYIKIADKVFSARKLLNHLGVEIYGNGTFLCPFHDDTRRSAKFFPEANNMYCFAERRVYGSYDMLRYLGKTDTDIFKSLRDSGKLGTIVPEVVSKKVSLKESDISDIRKNLLLKKLTLVDACRQIVSRCSNVLEV